MNINTFALTNVQGGNPIDLGYHRIETAVQVYYYRDIPEDDLTVDDAGQREAARLKQAGLQFNLSMVEFDDLQNSWLSEDMDGVTTNGAPSPTVEGTDMTSEGNEPMTTITRDAAFETFCRMTILEAVAANADELRTDLGGDDGTDERPVSVETALSIAKDATTKILNYGKPPAETEAP
jgi:hypothetical protein